MGDLGAWGMGGTRGRGERGGSLTFLKGLGSGKEDCGYEVQVLPGRVGARRATLKPSGTTTVPLTFV